MITSSFSSSSSDDDGGLSPSRGLTSIFASLYIVSGITQPLLMNVCKESGLADPSAQLYMLFYYLGPSALLLTLLGDYHHEQKRIKQQQAQAQAQQQIRYDASSASDGSELMLEEEYYQRHFNNSSSSTTSCAGTSSGSRSSAVLPSRRAILQACGIASFDIVAQALNYTGAGMAGSSIFAVIYSSVTIWTALWSRLILKRSLSAIQWLAVWIVFGGLAMTATNTSSNNVSTAVTTGALLVVAGSAMHGATYVLSESIMNHGPPTDRLTVRQNAAIQATLASLVLGAWQVVYTLPRWDAILGEPARAAGTTVKLALTVLLGFALVNLVHSLTFLHTLKHYPGGATSAGVMKGLQAVLVFVATHVLFCGRTGGAEMCFSFQKLFSLVAVVSGVTIFGVATEQRENDAAKRGYMRIGSTVVGDVTTSNSRGSLLEPMQSIEDTEEGVEAV